MKLLGVVSIILSSTMTGYFISQNAGKKVKICFQLKALCDSLLFDMSYRITPICELVDSLLNGVEFSALDFISSENIRDLKSVSSCLKNTENEEISRFFYSLGKSDINTQKTLIKGFKEYISKSEEEYSESFKKNSKLYLTFGAFFGIVSALILI